MATRGDDPKKVKQDRKLVSQQPHEVRYVQKVSGQPAPVVKQAIKDAGPSRKSVMKKLGK